MRSGNTSLVPLGKQERAGQTRARKADGASRQNSRTRTTLGLETSVGSYDSVYADCPVCGTQLEFQSKAGECMFRRDTPEEAPEHVLADCYAQVCDCKIGLRLDPKTKRIETIERAQVEEFVTPGKERSCLTVVAPFAECLAWIEENSADDLRFEFTTLDRQWIRYRSDWQKRRQEELRAQARKESRKREQRKKELLAKIGVDEKAIRAGFQRSIPEPEKPVSATSWSKNHATLVAEATMQEIGREYVAHLITTKPLTYGSLAYYGYLRPEVRKNLTNTKVRVFMKHLGAQSSDDSIKEMPLIDLLYMQLPLSAKRQKDVPDDPIQPNSLVPRLADITVDNDVWLCLDGLPIAKILERP